MAGEWTPARLGDVADLLTGFPFRRLVRSPSLTFLRRAPCEGAISQWGTDPPGNFRFGR